MYVYVGCVCSIVPEIDHPCFSLFSEEFILEQLNQIHLHCIISWIKDVLMSHMDWIYTSKIIFFFVFFLSFALYMSIQYKLSMVRSLANDRKYNRKWMIPSKTNRWTMPNCHLTALTCVFWAEIECVVNGMRYKVLK